MAVRRRWPPSVSPPFLVSLAFLLAFLLFDPGSSLADLGQYPQSSLHPRSESASMLQDLLEGIVFWVILIFVVVEAALIVAVLRFRHRPGNEEAHPVHGNTPLEIAWTIAPALILTFIAVPTVKTIFREAAVPKNALPIEVVGHQWWWEFRYPGLGVITANEVHVPVGRTVRMALQSADVVHSFWIPAFAGKRDLEPGRTTYIWFTAQVADTFPGQCAEFCGLSHANMRMRVIALPPAEFDAWVARQKTPPFIPAAIRSAAGVPGTASAATPSAADTSAASTPAAAGSTEKLSPEHAALVAKGFQTYITGQCVACHTIDGVSYGQLGPNLSHVASRTTIAGAIYPNDAEQLFRWIKNAPARKPGALMPNMNLTDEQAQALVAFLQTLR